MVRGFDRGVRLPSGDGMSRPVPHAARDPRPGAAVLPTGVVDAVAPVPGGAHPSYAHGYYERDNAFYVAWDAIGRDRDRFLAWMRRHVLGTADLDEYRASLAAETLTV